MINSYIRDQEITINYFQHTGESIPCAVSPNYISFDCKECKRIRARNTYLQKNYDINLEQYDKILKEQNGVCAICHKPETERDGKLGTPFSLAVDHDHNTGKIRELLCSRCNKMLGSVNDDTQLLKTMIEYLEKHNNSLHHNTP